jgi:hypothetical protein
VLAAGGAIRAAARIPNAGGRRDDGLMDLRCAGFIAMLQG